MASLMLKEALIVFLKQPVEGRVKTRIATATNHKVAVAVYLELLSKTANVVNNIDQDVYLFSDVMFDIPYFKSDNHFLQAQGDLGHKMLSAFQEVFKLGYGKVGIIGSDCFELTASLIHQNFKKLNGSSVVFGPSLDGGYYFLGMDEIRSDLFKNISWSTNQVLRQSVLKLDKLQIPYSFGDRLSDVDTLKDVLQYPSLKNALEKH